MKWTLKYPEKFNELSLAISQKVTEDWVEYRRNSYFIAIGDYTCKKYDFLADFFIYDGVTHRTEPGFTPILSEPGRSFKVCNKAGTVSDNAFSTISQHIEVTSGFTKTYFEVDGEEDLLVLPCVLLAEDYDFILYGDPFENCTRAIIVCPETRRAVLNIMATCGVWE